MYHLGPSCPTLSYHTPVPHFLPPQTSDYCIGRFSQMMWRLNFLVLVVCMVMRNSYMLYYICPMHTIFTILVYACLGIAPQYNQSNAFLLVK